MCFLNKFDMIKKKILLFMGLCTIMLNCYATKDLISAPYPSKSDLIFKELARSWDEGIPLGNATVGALIWEKGTSLRMSLDRIDLWDLRKVDSLSGSNFRFSWVIAHVKSKNYLPVQKKFDFPYENEPAPTKIPGAAIEFPLNKLGTPSSVHLYLRNALCEITWKNGVRMKTFVHATLPIGWFVFENLNTSIIPNLIPPLYVNKNRNGAANSVTGQNLSCLGYKQGSITHNSHEIIYHQKGYGNFYYDVVVRWRQEGKKLYGTWSITSSLSSDRAIRETQLALKRGIQRDYQSHLLFWNRYWAQSSIQLPDTILQKQYDNEMYKFGSAARSNSYPISLQSVWTADNGKLPPWKGDYHNDLNTELSYWPAYISNHLSEETGYLNTLWAQCNIYKRYTHKYFGCDGLNIPGVCTLTGEPMGGWVQYSMSQTLGAWLAQHFYLHWKYSGDRTFLKERAYPFVKDVGVFLEQHTQIKDGIRTLEYSTSPEVYGNSLKAWFPTISNFDLSLIRFLFKAATEMADNLNMKQEAAHWKKLESELPDFDLADDSSLTFAKGLPYNFSHRHFSHAMAIYPLGLINWTDGPKSQQIIRATINRMEKYGPDYWCGYSYSWLGCIKARAFDGDGATDALRTFAQCFCLKNTFHVNGDQTRSGKSKFTYRPFTLEGNFAFAAGVLEMLLQSHTGIIYVFPAIPHTWKNVSFSNLRAMGGFLVTASMKDGKVTKLKVFSEKGGKVKIVSPIDNKVKEYSTKSGEWIEVIS
jgi:alpha-L-fucosidase 2